MSNQNFRRRRKKPRGRTPARNKQSGLTGSFEGEVSALAHRGDGMIKVEGEVAYVPYVLPNEKVSFKMNNGKGALTQVLEPSPDRVEPECSYFGTCGGCDLQHMKQEAYLAWKKESVQAALSRKGIEDVPIRDVLATEPGCRRRVTFSANRKGKKLNFGYHKRASHEVVHIEVCPLLDPEIENAIPGLKKFADILFPSENAASFLVTKTDSGLDLSISSEGKQEIELSYDQREDMAELTKELNITRLSIDDELIIQHRQPFIDVRGVSVPLPAGAFLQVSETSQQCLQDLVLEATQDAENIADLFCGCGTFALMLAHQIPVLAVDGAETMLSALRQAADQTQGLKEIKVERRNLFEAPLEPSELKKIDAVVFDPPRAGAKAQAQALAKSNVRRVVGVSCDPGSFARDAQILIEGGYKLDWVAPVDQFLWSHHIELVGCFTRP